MTAEATTRVTAPDPAGEPRRTLGGRAVDLLIDSRPVLLAVMILGLGTWMAISHGTRFINEANLASVLLDAAQAGILTIGMTILMIGGAIDLSIGAVLTLAGVVAAVLVREHSVDVAFAMGVALLVGAACGVVNGVIVTRLHINALIATLATMGIYRGIAQIISGTGITTIGHGFAWIGQTELLGIQYPFWIMFGLVLVFTFLTNRSRFFRQFFFIGGNERAARLSGIQSDRVIFAGFVLVCVLAALSGLLTASRLDSAIISAGTGVELKVITAAVLGGAALKGGSGSIPGAFLGVIFIAMLQNALIISRVPVFYQQIVVGLVLIAAVSTEYLQSRRGR
jgi:ribose/xylose/arabinose/galactoside ABC-type transport system permease subunit